MGGPMSTRTYQLPVEETRWHIPAHGADTVFSWEYDEGRDRLLHLYEKGKDRQWNAQHRIDWSTDIDFSAQTLMPDFQVPIFGSPLWDKLSRQEKDDLRKHAGSWLFSQFLHGEQGALVCGAKIVSTVPDIDSKFYASTQVIDEARHCETFAKFLNEKMEMTYPINRHLKTLLDQTIGDERWDFTYLGMQIMVEGVALGAFGVVRDLTEEPLVKSMNAYIMADEARHVAFGILALQDAYADLTQAEKDEREEFVVEASYLLRDRFLAEEVWENLDLPTEECMEYVRQSPWMAEYRRQLFSRIVPNVKRIGLWGDKVQKAYEEMGVLHFQDAEPEELLGRDEVLAEEIERAIASTKETGAIPADLVDTRAGEIAETIAAGAE
ncbi:MAG: ferritin-like domain-containing protein [Acidimicrobiia bacterium]|nr:ferritin-like domain-containing protein [Acidimicrobiia bacterium]MBP8179807.1 ferritin-like domain-containing protein [Acidimicrobiia bacterium]